MNRPGNDFGHVPSSNSIYPKWKDRHIPPYSWVNRSLTHHTAITNEYVQPRKHEDVDEKITREIHTHDVYHYVLPIIETEILPPKHFVESPDGCGVVKVPENEVHNYTMTGTWVYGQPNMAKPTESQIVVDRESNKLLEKGPSRRAPILADQMTYTTKEGMQRTEYLWRHPPVFEDASGRAEPVRIPAGLTSEWKRLFHQEDQSKLSSSKQQAVGTQASENEPSALRHTAQSAPNSIDTSHDVASVSKSSIPVKVNPHKNSALDKEIRTDSNGVNSGRMRGRRHGLAKKGSHSNLKGLVDKKPPGDEGPSKKRDGGYSKGSGSTKDFFEGRPSDMDGPNSQLWRETVDRAGQEVFLQGKMDIDND